MQCFLRKEDVFDIFPPQQMFSKEIFAPREQFWKTTFLRLRSRAFLLAHYCYSCTRNCVQLGHVVQYQDSIHATREKVTYRPHLSVTKAELLENTHGNGGIVCDFPDRVFLKSKMTSDYCVFKFFRPCVDGKRLMCFQSETSVFKFIQRSVKIKGFTDNWSWTTANNSHMIKKI